MGGRALDEQRGARAVVSLCHALLATPPLWIPLVSGCSGRKRNKNTLPWVLGPFRPPPSFCRNALAQGQVQKT